MIGVELLKLLRRPRTWVVIALMDALPTLVAVLLALTDLGPRPGTGPAFLSAVLNNGALFPAAALAIVLPLFLPSPSRSSAATRSPARRSPGRCATCSPGRWPHPAAGREAGRGAGLRRSRWSWSWWHGVLRRARLLLGRAAGGDVGLRGAALTPQQPVMRTLLAMAYVAALDAGRRRDRAVPVHVHRLAAGRGDGRAGVPGHLRSCSRWTPPSRSAPYLPTRYWLAFVDLFRQPILWRDIVRGVASSPSTSSFSSAPPGPTSATKDIKS